MRTDPEAEQTLFADVAGLLLKLTNADEVSVLMRSGDSLRFLATVSAKGPRKDLVGTLVPVAGTIVGLVAVTGESHVDAPHRKIPSEDVDGSGAREPTSVFAIPIHVGDLVEGVVSGVSFQLGYQLADGHLRDAERMTRVLAGALSLASRRRDADDDDPNDAFESTVRSAGRLRLDRALRRLDALDDMSCERMARLVEAASELKSEA